MKTADYLAHSERRDAFRTAYEYLEESDQDRIDAMVLNLISFVKTSSNTGQLSEDGALEILSAIGRILNH